MSKTPLAVVHEMFEHFNNKDVNGILNTVSEDTLWIHHGSQKMRSRRYLGKSGVGKFFGGIFSGNDFNYFRTLEFIDKGNVVVVVGEESFPSGDGSMNNKWVQIYRIENGLITHMDEYATSEDDKDYIVID